MSWNTRLVSDQVLIVPETDGTKTILDARDVFLAGISSNFQEWGCCITGTPTPQVPAEARFLVESATFEEIFDIELAGRFWTSTDQITKFVTCNRNWMWDDRGGDKVFPLIIWGKKFIASAYYRADGRLGAHLLDFVNERVWHSRQRRRFIVPQPAVVQ